MRLDVIADCCRLHDAALSALRTERMLEQLVPPDPSPVTRRVPMIPFGRSAANAHGSARRRAQGTNNGAGGTGA
jgi:hypothetical protein